MTKVQRHQWSGDGYQRCLNPGCHVDRSGLSHIHVVNRRSVVQLPTSCPVSYLTLDRAYQS
jgi:hypothetical protein